MSALLRILQAHPRRESKVHVEALADCADACYDCAASCVACADACLAMDDVKPFTRCISINHDCADICFTTGKLLSRQTELDWVVLRGQLSACSSACLACADECDRHAAGHSYCAACAQACRRCEEACSSLLLAVPSYEAA